MTVNDLEREIESNFNDLFKKNKFSLIFKKSYPEHFGSYIIIWQSDLCSCGIRFVLDKRESDIYLQVGPDTTVSAEFGGLTSAEWTDIFVLLDFIAPYSNLKKTFCDKQESGVSKEMNYELKLKRLSEIIQPYWNEILEIFKKNDLSKLKNFKENRAKKAADKYSI